METPNLLPYATSDCHQGKSPVRNSSAKPKRAQPRRPSTTGVSLFSESSRSRQQLHRHAKRRPPRRHNRRQVSVQPKRATPSRISPTPQARPHVDAGQPSHPRSCAFTATTPASSGPTARHARPAPAAAASRWPTFDLRDAHRTPVQLQEEPSLLEPSRRACSHTIGKALSAAPTCG